MQFEEVEIPSETRTRPVYGLLVSAVSASDWWIRVPLVEIAGKDLHDKRAAVLQAMKQAGIRVTTRTDINHIYISRCSATEGAL
jgi:hypothetical protein